MKEVGLSDRQEEQKVGGGDQIAQWKNCINKINV